MVLSDGLFWSTLLGGFVIAFLITTPVNKWMIGRGEGHAVVHAYHWHSYPGLALGRANPTRGGPPSRRG